MSESASPTRAMRVNRVLRAATIYFAIVFAVGLVLGPPRVLWLEPWLGTTLAVLCEAPLLILAMAIGARAAPTWAGMSGGWISHLAMGLIALALQQVADLAVGFGLRGLTLNEQIAYFSQPAGYIYAATLIVFAVMPLVVFVQRRRRISDERAS
jgi:hypothetical protein